MIIKQVKLVYFSPTGTVRRTLRKIAEGIGGQTEEYDLTPFAARWQKYSFAADDVALIGMPVYRGRIPPIGEELFRGIVARSTPAVYVVCYGNREYEDALLELQQSCEQRGFKGIAAAAFIGEHSYSSEIASGRPDEQDEEKALHFGRQIGKKLKTLLDSNSLPQLHVKGNFPYVQPREAAIAPATNERCVKCGLCSRECPMCAINPADPRDIDIYRCLACCRCIRNCPHRAKYMDNDRIKRRIAMLKEKCADRKEPEVFI